MNKPVDGTAMGGATGTAPAAPATSTTPADTTAPMGTPTDPTATTPVPSTDTGDTSGGMATSTDATAPTMPTTGTDEPKKPEEAM